MYVIPGVMQKCDGALFQRAQLADGRWLRERV